MPEIKVMAGGMALWRLEGGPDRSCTTIGVTNAVLGMADSFSYIRLQWPKIPATHPNTWNRLDQYHPKRQTQSILKKAENLA
jgi:hypothetical protein